MNNCKCEDLYTCKKSNYGMQKKLHENNDKYIMIGCNCLYVKVKTFVKPGGPIGLYNRSFSYTSLKINVCRITFLKSHCHKKVSKSHAAYKLSSALGPW